MDRYRCLSCKLDRSGKGFVSFLTQYHDSHTPTHYGLCSVCDLAERMKAVGVGIRPGMSKACHGTCDD